MSRKINHGGKDYESETWELPDGKYIVGIRPVPGVGKWLREPDIQITSGGNTRTIKGKPVQFDTENAADDAAEDNVKKGMI